MNLVELLGRLRDVLKHGKMGDKYLITPDLVYAAIASLSAPKPDGNWVLVPMEPTSAMVAEAHTVDTGHGSWPRNAYARMIAAAPQPPAEAQPVGEAGALPGSNGGFTTAVFKAVDVPVGTKLYTHQTSQFLVEAAQPVAWADPQAFVNFREKGHLGGVYAREWMWANPGAGLAPLYAHPPPSAPVEEGEEDPRAQGRDWWHNNAVATEVQKHDGWPDKPTSHQFYGMVLRTHYRLLKEATLAQQPPAAPVGVETKMLARDIHYAIRDAGLAPESPTDDAAMRNAIVHVLKTSFAQQPAPSASQMYAHKFADTQQPEACVGCEGDPSGENNPCQVCGEAGDYPSPRNRQEAEALLRMVLAYLDVNDAHIAAVISRCEAGVATDQRCKKTNPD